MLAAYCLGSETKAQIEIMVWLMRGRVQVAVALAAAVLTAGCSASPASLASPVAPAATPSSTPTATGALPTTTASARSPSVPGKTPNPSASLTLVEELIPYGAQRRAQMADYALRHYGTKTSALTPVRIVVHLTASDSARSAIDLFSSNEVHLGDLPGTCAHYLVDQDGTVYHLVPDEVMCRHVIGLNDQALGVEVVQSTIGGSSAAARQVLDRPAQANALVALLAMLMERHHLTRDAVIGHATANDDPAFHDLLGWRNDHTDWGRSEIAALRRRL